ncbi:hypothetical protein H2199_008794 [Coniosporium tulheliwenetii]|uniref:Uncharacterized protein n=1 Tax=Coniosporium tulheliwenetii TaxID=3383036 RepID=A0ACC2YHV3_9PEZI|nr:hypothetical protein H2199_008794 [Cladosporium sp. JES 115]
MERWWRRSNEETERQRREEHGSSNPNRFWGTDRVRAAMQKERSARMGARMSTSIYRHAYLAIRRELTQDKGVAQMLNLIYEGKEKGDGDDDVRARQAGHGKHMEEMIYGRALTESPFHTVSERHGFRRASTDWHRILHFPSAWAEGHVDPETRRRMQAEQEQEGVPEVDGVAPDGFDEAAEGVDGAGGGVQGVAEAGVGGDHATAFARADRHAHGGGKSLFFMLPAASSRDGVTVVIVPLCSLREDLKDRCDRAGISCAEWNGERPPHWANIVLVTPESAVTKAFGRFIDEKRTMRQLDRIVVDECHVVLDSSRQWRPQVLQLIEMTEKEAQLVYLTATLPPRNESEFYEAMDETTRKNVEYRVHEYEKENEDEEVERLVEEKKRQHPMSGQIVMYCKEIKQAKRFAGVLECSVCYREVGTKEKKRRILRRLTQGQEQVFTATNASGLGIDAPMIRVVIHVEIRQKMRDHMQESRRAGRDGLKSEAIIMCACWTDRDGRWTKEQGWKVEMPMKEFMEGDDCRRIALDKEMDGKMDRLGCERGEDWCDMCKGKPRGTRRRRVVVGNEDAPRNKREDSA